MKKLLLITLISGISFFYYYYNKNVEVEKDKEKVDIRWDDEIIYIDDLDNDIVYSGQLIIYEEPIPIYELYKRNNL